MITTKERAKLKALSNKLPDIVYVGKEGVTDNVVKQINDNLLAHEMIKIKVQPNAELTSREYAEMITNKCGCDPVSVCGGKIIVYKKTTKKNFKHYLD